MPATTETILIVGASARAAAHSARIAGVTPLAIDRFGDTDLREHCTSLCLESFPRGLLSAAKTLPDAPWMYTGPLENRSEIVDELMRSRLLYGNPAAVIRAVRNPFQVSEVLTRERLPVPAVRTCTACSGPPSPNQATWLEKPYRSGGGVGIREWPPSQPNSRSFRASYLQQFIPGQSISAVFVTADRAAQLVGATSQLIGCEWCGCDGYQFCGSIGPISLASRERLELERVGAVLADEFQLQGLVNVDAILCDGRVWPVEVNPRYSASVEVLERSCGPLLNHHIAACRDGVLFDLPTNRSGGMYGKAIIYARRTIQVPGHVIDLFSRHADSSTPPLADIPPRDAIVPRGHPVLTVFAKGECEKAIRTELKSGVRRIQSALDC